MSRFFLRLRPKGLQAKLTLFYTLVTLVAMLLMALVGTALWQAVYLRESVSLLRSDLATLEPALSAKMATRPSAAAWQSWLKRVNAEGLDGKYLAGYFTPESRVFEIVVLSLAGRTVYSNQSRYVPGSVLQTPLLHKVTAQVGLSNLTESEVRRSGLDYLEGLTPLQLTPSQSAQGKRLGYLYLRFLNTSVLSYGYLGALLSVFGVLSVIILLLGGLFGYLIARWVMRRLRAITLVTRAWQQGDFAPRLVATSADELGLLSRDLNHMATELEAYVNVRQEVAALEERARLAYDLHDSVKQQLFAASMQLAAAQMHLSHDSKALIPLENANALTQQAVQELAVLINNLRPAPLEQARLGAVLAKLLESWAKHSGVSVSSQLAPAIEVTRVQEEVFYRVVQEGLANIAKHSGATRVSLRLEATEDGVRLRLEDNGSGFEAEKQHAGLGLSSMRSRLERHGGSLQIVSSAAGTVLSASLPKAKKADPKL